MKLKLLFTSILTALLFFCVSVKPVVATTTPFSTTLTTTYTVVPSGPTQVKADFVITNQTSTTFASKYAIEISSPNIQNVRVFTEAGDLISNVTPTDSKTTIGIEFPDKIVGKDQQRKFSLTYLHPTIVQVEGKVAEVHIPRLTKPEEFSATVTHIQLPQEFGQPTVSLPSTFLTTSQDTFNTFTFDNIGNTPITLLFGKEQTYDFSFTYLLSNPSGTKGIVQVPLPPDTLYQRLTYQKLEPTPEELKADDDGNWIATYTLESQQQQAIQVAGQVTTFVKPQQNFPVPSVKEEYTQADTYWEKNAEELQLLGQQARTPAEILTTVTQTLDYNYERKGKELNRTGALFALQHPTNALAQDYADLFVTLARVSNIPARQLIGYAFSQDPINRPIGVGKSDFHVWPEYFSDEEKTWISVDPTWQDTSGFEYFQALDFRRIVFATLGSSSQQPVPPGIFPEQSVELKDPVIQLSPNTRDMKDAVAVNISPQFGAFFGIGSRYTITIENTTGHSIYNLPITLSNSNQVHVNPTEYVIEQILPFQKESFPITVATINVVDDTSSKITISVLDQHFDFAVTANSLLRQFIHNPLILIGTILIGLGIILGSWLGYMVLKKGNRS